jgi:hypothetical protein
MPPAVNQRGKTMHLDAVFWGSIITVVIAVVIVIFLGFKVKALINKDAEAHKNQ